MYDNPSNPRRHFRKLRGRGRPETKRRFKMTTTLANGKKARTSFVATKSQAFSKANRLVGQRFHGSAVRHVVLDYRNKPEGSSSRPARKAARKKGYRRGVRKSRQSKVGVIPALFGFGETPKREPKKRASRLAAIKAAHARHSSKTGAVQYARKIIQDARAAIKRGDSAEEQYWRKQWASHKKHIGGLSPTQFLAKYGKGKKRSNPSSSARHFWGM